MNDPDPTRPAHTTNPAMGLCPACRGRLDRRSTVASCARFHTGHRGETTPGDRL